MYICSRTRIGVNETVTETETEKKLDTEIETKLHRPPKLATSLQIS